MISLTTCQRTDQSAPSLSVVEDAFEHARCRFLRFLTSGEYALPDVKRLHACPAGGWLLEGKEIFWLPRLPVARRLDRHGHILAEQEIAVSSLELNEHGLAVSLAPSSDFVVDAVLWQLSPELQNELTQLYPMEMQAYFLWGSHTQYRKPADLYLHLIHGWVYENRATWPKYWKICSENDAHALYVLFSGLERATGKTLYRLFKQQLILSVLHRQAEDGGFYHGEWTDQMESHFRLVASAAHLLMDALEEYQDPVIKKALIKVTDFLSQQHDRLECGIWFLHDSLEKSQEGMRKSPFSWLPSRAFGKSESNMLVLNTHLDITIALARAAELLKLPDWQALLPKVNQVTLAVLTARPAEWLYRLVFGAIALSFLPTAQASSLPLWQRAIKRLGWKYAIPSFHYLKQLFPRLVMPGGYVDRALSLRGISTAYQAINVMDLARLQALFSELPLRLYIEAAVAFTFTSGLWQRWQEEEKSRYALGFWAEALRWMCLQNDDLYWRNRLAETMICLARLGLGQPPGLLGGSAKARVDPTNWQARNIPPGIQVADLSNLNTQELLLVNPTDQSVVFEGDLRAWRWHDSTGNPISSISYILAPGQWMTVGR